MDIIINQIGPDSGDTNGVKQATFVLNNDDKPTQISASKDDGASAKTVFDTGTEAWSSQTSQFDTYQRLQSQRVVFDDGGQQNKNFDNANNRLWDERDVTTDPANKITDVKLKLNGETATRSAASSVDYSVIGQVFGSAIGRAIAGKDANPFVSLTAGTVAGYVGQKFVQALLNGPDALDLSKLDIADVFNGQGVSLAGAGLGAASSFLTAEIATSIGLTGVGQQLFAAAAGGYAGSVLEQVRKQGFAVLTTGINWDAALHASEVNIASAFGSLLAHQFHPAESEYGGLGGQLAGALGSALAYSFSVGLGSALNVVLPGIGAFFGTIIGTIIGDAIAGDPGYPKAAHDIQILGSDYHFTNRLIGTDDHGNAAVSQEMGDQVVKIANSFLDAVHGAGIAYPGKVDIGYNTGAAPYAYIAGWFPKGTEPTPHFQSASDAIQEGVRELLMQTQVIGGDLLVKRAQQAFVHGPHADPFNDPADFTDLATFGGDLRTAQDYQQYLNDRETINALIELYPNSAFTAGWAATFARVNELGLNHVNASDLLGGLVGYLDSVNKAGLGAVAANASVKLSGGNVTIDVKVPNGADVPGSLSVFADQTSQSSDATGTTVHFTFANGLAVGGFHTLATGAGAGDGVNDIWFGGDGGSNFAGTGGHDILTGGAGNDTISGGAGFDFIDGGAGYDTLLGGDGNDILRGGTGNDNLQGGGGNDTYVFNRGDGADTVLDDYTPVEFVPASSSGFGGTVTGGVGVGSYQAVHHNGGTDSLLFGPGISVADIRVQVSSNNGLTVGIKDPARPGTAFAQLTDTITLQHWFDSDGFDRIEKFVFADGTTLDLSAGQAALAPLEVPFAATLSFATVAGNSANGTVVGTVAGLDLDAAAVLSYSLTADAGGRFAINAATGVITVANGALLADQAATSQTITVRTADQSGHWFEKAFAIAVTDGVKVVAGTPGNDHLVGSSANEIFIGGANTITPTLGNLPVQTGSMGIEWLVISTQDFSGDGKGDIMWVRNDAGDAALWTMNNGTLSSFSPTQGHMGQEWKAVGSGDFNHDGKADMVWTSGGDIALWQMDGANLTAFATPSGHMGPEWHVQVIGDFNGDGFSDILWHSDGGAVADWSMSGNTLGGFGISNGSMGPEWTARAAGDFNGDGRDEVLWVSRTGDLQTWTMFGSNVTQLTNTGHMGTEWHVAGTGDFNMDGKSDLVWVSDANDVQIWEMNGGSIAQIVVPAGHMGSEWHPEGVGDFTGDARPDLLWVNGSGQTSVWNMVGNGDVMTGGGGTDTFRFDALNETGKVITDFTPGAGGDILSLHGLELATGFSGGDGLTSGSVRLVQNGTDAEVQIDAHYGEHHWVDIATLQHVNVTALTHDNFLF